MEFIILSVEDRLMDNWICAGTFFPLLYWRVQSQKRAWDHKKAKAKKTKEKSANS
jgi:hypothetical protein